MHNYQLPTEKSFDKGQDTYNLTGEQMPEQDNNVVQPKMQLSEFQKKLLDEIHKDDRLVKIFQMIFRNYPQIIVTEYRQTHPQATPRQQLKSRETTMHRLKLEAQLEEEIVKLAGIDIDKLHEENNVVQTEEEVSEAIEKEHEALEE